MNQLKKIGTEELKLPSFDEVILESLCNSAIDILKQKNQTLLRIPSPSIVIGDIHGNFHDLIRIMNSIADIFSNSVVFLGDYVDRGNYQIETITLLLALRIEYPNNIFLLRGNHEFTAVNSYGGFKKEILESGYSETLFNKFNEVFSWFPIAAIINEHIFCVHGGLSPFFHEVKQIETEFKLPIKYIYTTEVAAQKRKHRLSDSSDEQIARLNEQANFITLKPNINSNTGPLNSPFKKHRNSDITNPKVLQMSINTQIRSSLEPAKIPPFPSQRTSSDSKPLFTKKLPPLASLDIPDPQILSSTNSPNTSNIPQPSSPFSNSPPIVSPLRSPPLQDLPPQNVIFSNSPPKSSQLQNVQFSNSPPKNLPLQNVQFSNSPPKSSPLQNVQLSNSPPKNSPLQNLDPSNVALGGVRSIPALPQKVNSPIKSMPNYIAQMNVAINMPCPPTKTTSMRLSQSPTAINMPSPPTKINSFTISPIKSNFTPKLQQQSDCIMEDDCENDLEYYFNNTKLLTDIMWSDPTNSTELFLPNNRGSGCYFGFVVTNHFLQKNNMKMIVRGHESTKKGIETSHEKKVITVYSSSSMKQGGFAACIIFEPDDSYKCYRLKPINLIQRSDAKFYTPVFKSYHIIESLSVNSFPRLMSQGKVFSNKYTRKTARVSQPALFNGKQDNTEMNSNDQ